MQQRGCVARRHQQARFESPANDFALHSFPDRVEFRTGELQMKGMYMRNQTPNPPAVIAFPNKEDDLDKVGHAASDFIHQAASRAEQQAQQVMAVAHKLSLQLRAAEDRLAGLENEVKHYRHRADPAEKWLHRIELEIQHTFFSRKMGTANEELENLRRYAPKQRQIS